MTWLAVVVAGGLGSVARFLVDGWISQVVGGRFPYGTWTVNISGSLLAGIVAGLGVAGHLGSAVDLVVAGGFLGAYTTFSTAMFQAAVELREGMRVAGAADLVGTLVLAVAAAWVGMAITTLV